MEKHASALSHSINRLLGRTDDEHHDRMKTYSRNLSECHKKRQDIPVAPETRKDTAEPGSSSTPNQEQRSLCVFPWMQIRRTSREKKRRKSKEIIVFCIE